MTTTELKHQALLQEWAERIRACRSSGLQVKTWCRENYIPVSTYYRWERELISNAPKSIPPNKTHDLPAKPVFMELSRITDTSREKYRHSAVIQIGDARIEVPSDIAPDLLKMIVEAVRSC